MQKYNIILWDIDNTLLDFQYSQKKALSACFKKAGLTITDEIVDRYDKINESYWKMLERGEITKERLLRERFEKLFLEYHIEGIDIENFRKDYQIGLSEYYFYIEDSLNLCKSLKTICRQYAVTNGVEFTQVRKLQLSGLWEIFDDVFISEKIGVPKPAKEFFEACFERIPDFDKERTLIIGDSLTSDMQGGINAGIATCWYNPKKESTNLRIDYEIHALKDVMGIIKGN